MTKQGPPSNITPFQALSAATDEPPITASPPPASDQPSPNVGEDASAPPDPDGYRHKDRPSGQIWQGCPVTPLGHLDGIYFYLDPHGQLRRLTKHDAQSISMLFAGSLHKLYHGFPKMVVDKKTGALFRKQKHFDHQLALDAMVSACGECGIFSPEGSIRGVGAWADDEGRLIYHMGDTVLIDGQEVTPSRHQNRIYTAAPAIPHPARPARSDAVDRLREAASTWNFTRPDIDVELVIGMVGVLMMGGALDWRSTFWLTGGAGTGKSDFQRMVLHLMGGEAGLVQSVNTTASGISSKLGYSTLPVSCDELDRDADDARKVKAIIELARVASSGGVWMRGSSDQKGTSGQLRSTFMFSSILIPGGMDAQDRQRLIILSLDGLPEGAVPPSLRADTWRGRGAAIKRDLIDRWPSWAARLDLWLEAFQVKRITGRAAKNWATTLAMAQMMRTSEMPSVEEMAGWVAKVALHIAGEPEENDANEVLMHLLTTVYDPFRRGDQYTLAQWFQVAAGLPSGPAGLCDGAADRRKAADAQLARLMIKVITHRDGSDPCLFVGNAKARPLLELFQTTKWAGGAWKQSLGRIKGASVPDKTVSRAGVDTRGVLIPFTSIPSLAVFAQHHDVPDAPPPSQPVPGMEDYQ